MNEESKQINQEEETESVHIGLLDSKGHRPSPWSWIPSLYYAEGIPYILAMTVSVIMYKKMGISNTDIALYTSLLYLPWVIKPLWSPLVDIVKTKRWWIVTMQLILGLGLGTVAIAIPLPNFFKITLFILWIIAFSSATHDIACDGFYLLGSSKHQQAWFVGVRATFYRFAMLTGQGLLVIFAGMIESQTGLEAVHIKVNAVQDTQITMPVVKYANPSSEELAIIMEKAPLDVLSFYSTKAKEAKSLDEAATFAQLTENKFNKISKDLDPLSSELIKAKELNAAAIEALSNFLRPLMQEKEKLIQPESSDEVRIIMSTEELNIPIQNISKVDSELTIYVTKKWNLLQGQQEHVVVIPKEEKKEQGIIDKIWNKVIANPISVVWKTVVANPWKKIIASPMEKFLKNNFGQEKKAVSTIAGGVSDIYLHLSKPPEAGKEITVTFGRKSGDKSLELKEGIRFIFNEKNWNKPVRALIQVDHRLKEPTEAEFVTAAGNISLSWTVTFFAMGALFIFFCIYHFFFLPYPVADTSRYVEAHKSGTPFRFTDFVKEFGITFVSFFQKKGILKMLIFLLTYRFAESQLVKLSSPFMLDSREAGGLALTTGQVGIAYGTVGLICLSLGGILGGILAARDGLKKWILPMALAITIPHAAYVYLAYAQPENFIAVCCCVGLETLGYGFGFTAYMLYMIFISEGTHKTAHFAITTGFMAMGMMIPGMISGWIQSIIGYLNFYIYIMIASFISVLVIFIIPLDPKFGKKGKKENKE